MFALRSTCQHPRRRCPSEGDVNSELGHQLHFELRLINS